jgi:hypothetical protein
LLPYWFAFAALPAFRHVPAGPFSDHDRGYKFRKRVLPEGLVDNSRTHYRRVVHDASFRGAAFGKSHDTRIATAIGIDSGHDIQ